MTRKIRIVIQARMNSSRLPGKIAADVAGRPMLAYTVGRLRAAAQHGAAFACGAGLSTAPEQAGRRRAKDSTSVGAPIWELMVATTSAPADDATERLCESLGVACFRGAESDVLDRYVAAAADLEPGDTLIRATGDNPLYCPMRSAAIVADHAFYGGDYTCIENLSYVVPEVMQVDALRQMASLATDEFCREHVTPYFRRPTCGFRVVQLAARWRGLRPDVRLTVDTPAELAQMRRLVDALKGDKLAPLERVYEACDRVVVGQDSPQAPATTSRKAAVA